MRRSFDLLTVGGWQSWWGSKFSRWGYIHIPHDTWMHVICLFRGHLHYDQHIGASVYCRRCYMLIEYRSHFKTESGELNGRR